MGFQKSEVDLNLYSIMNNDVWEIVMRHEGKSMVTSWCFYQLNHVFYGSVEKHKAMLVE